MKCLFDIYKMDSNWEKPYCKNRKNFLNKIQKISLWRQWHVYSKSKSANFVGLVNHDVIRILI